MEQAEKKQEVILARHPGSQKPEEKIEQAPNSPAGEQGVNPDAPAPADVVPASSAPAPQKSEDDIFLEVLNKRNKTSFATIAEYEESLRPAPQKTKEEIEAEEEKFKNEAFKWKIDTDKEFKSKYEKRIADKEKSDRQIALTAFAAEVRSESKDTSDEEIEEMFKDTFHEDAEEGSARRNQGDKLIKKLASDYRNANYGEVDKYVDQYRDVVSYGQKVQSYEKSAKEAIKGLPDKITQKVSFPGPDGKDIEMDISVDVTDEDKKALNKSYWHANSTEAEKHFLFLGGGENPVSEDTMAASVNSTLLSRKFNN